MGIIEQLAEIKHQEGKDEGRQEGREEAMDVAVRAFLSHTEFSPEKIAEFVKVPVSFVERIKSEVSTK